MGSGFRGALDEAAAMFSHARDTSHTLLHYALAVGKVTTAKKATLILNVDGCIAVCFVDLLRDSGSFTREEADEYIKIVTLNGLFVLGRSIGVIGHHLGTSLHPSLPHKLTPSQTKSAFAHRCIATPDDIFINMQDVSQPRVFAELGWGRGKWINL